MTASAPCAHCGLPAPASDQGLSFCCAGCRTVYELLHEAGLGDYYPMRASLEAEPPASILEDAEGSARYASLDDPQIAGRYGLAPGRATLALTGLHCAACVWVLERLPRLCPGVISARVDYGRGRIHLRWDPAAVSLSTVAAMLHRLGYPPQLRDVDADAEHRRQGRRELWRLTVTGALMGNVMLMSFALYAGVATTHAGLGRFMEALSLLLAIPAVTWGALPFYRGAWSGLRAGVLHMDLPISLGLVAGFTGSVVATATGMGEPYYDSVTALVFLLLAGRTVQQLGQRRVATEGELWSGLVPGMARRWQEGRWCSVYTSTLEPGDRLRVEPGESFAADGRVVQGQGHADLSMLTGESRPVPLPPGQAVFAGTRSVGTAVELEVEAVGADTRLGRLLQGLGAADEDRAPVVRLADRLAGWFVAAVVVLAVVGGIGWWTFAGPQRAFEVVVSLLVVSCPCALGLATPLALTVARGRAAAAGYVLRSTAGLEALARVRRIVFDKTGTLTEGRVRVVDAGPELEAVRLAAVVERRARHPLASALLRWEDEQGGHGSVEATSVVEHPGRGIEGIVSGHRVRVGSPRWIPTRSLQISERLTSLRARALTPVLVEIDGQPRAVIGLGDRLRTEAPAVVAELRGRGYALALRSGDEPGLVQRVADSLGIADARGAQSPEDKAAEVQGQSGVAMVGDGINDAPALRAASVGVAVGGGAEAALMVADAYLRRPGVGPLRDLLLGARRAQAVVHRNLVFSLVYNLVFASLALAGIITPLWAAVLMPASSLTVILSCMLSRSFDAKAGLRRRAGTQTMHAPTHGTTADVL